MRLTEHTSVMTVRPLAEAELAWGNERYAEIAFVPWSARDLLAGARIAMPFG